mmetsp:Transcript_59574/g.141755  ORF Transcript_59574/g.141755 Transcript_59574/m.141755 type:complete len:204 (-) Transcript_59574:814-1425(-)
MEKITMLRIFWPRERMSINTTTPPGCTCIVPNTDISSRSSRCPMSNVEGLVLAPHTSCGDVFDIQRQVPHNRIKTRKLLFEILLLAHHAAVQQVAVVPDVCSKRIALRRNFQRILKTSRRRALSHEDWLPCRGQRWLRCASWKRCWRNCVWNLSGVVGPISMSHRWGPLCSGRNWKALTSLRTNKHVHRVRKPLLVSVPKHCW